MAAAQQSSSMGATVYFGLIGLTLISAGPSPTQYLNPQKTMSTAVFEQELEEAPLVDPFSWPIASQLVDHDIASFALAALPRDLLDARPLEPGPASERPPLEAFLPTTFAAGPAVAEPAATARWGGIETTTRQVTSIIGSHTTEHEQTPQFQTTTAARPDLSGPGPMPTAPSSQQWQNPKRFTVTGRTAFFKPTPLRFSRPDLVAPNKDAHWTGFTTGDRVFLREAPSLDAPPIDLIAAGTALLVSQTRGNWHRVEVSNQTGWMFAEFVQAD